MNKFVEKYRDDIVSYEEIEPIGPHWIIDIGDNYAVSIITEKYKRLFTDEDTIERYEAALLKMKDYGDYEMVTIDSKEIKELSEYLYDSNTIRALKEDDVIDLIETLRQSVKEDRKDYEGETNDGDKTR
jgi:non-homologous end joining protein Ku